MVIKGDLYENNQAAGAKYLNDLIKEQISPCFQISLMKEGKLIFDCALGHEAYSAGAEPIHQRSMFDIASVTKVITGSLIIKLAELGKLALADPVSRYIQEFKFQEIQIIHLLTHTSGFDDSHIPGRHPSESEVKGFFELLYKGNNPRSAAGAQSQYSTFTFSILMDIIQRVSGQSIESFARKHLFELLEMNDTTYDRRSFGDKKLVIPLHFETNELETHVASYAITGDGGLYSNANDLVKFGQMLLEGGEGKKSRVFSKESINLICREVTKGQFYRTPLFFRKGDNESNPIFADLHSPDALAHHGFYGCMMFVDPVYKKTAALITNSEKLQDNPLYYKRICNFLMAME